MSVSWMVTNLCHFDILRAPFAQQQSIINYSQACETIFYSLDSFENVYIFHTYIEYLMNYFIIPSNFKLNDSNCLKYNEVQWLLISISILW